MQNMYLREMRLDYLVRVICERSVIDRSGIETTGLTHAHIRRRHHSRIECQVPSTIPYLLSELMVYELTLSGKRSKNIGLFWHLYTHSIDRLDRLDKSIPFSCHNLWLHSPLNIRAVSM
jgi:hypothetical protein